MEDTLPFTDIQYIPIEAADVPTDIAANRGRLGQFEVGATGFRAENMNFQSGESGTAKMEVGAGSNAGGVSSAGSGSEVVIWAGAEFDNRLTAPFRVLANGTIIATAAIINGRTFTADSEYGDGSDGNSTITSDTVFTRDMFYDTCTIDNMVETTFSPATTSSGDGYVTSTAANTAWGSLRNNSGTAANNAATTITVEIDTGTTSNTFDTIRRGILVFSTSSLSDSISVYSAKVRLYVSSLNDNLNQSLCLVTRTSPGTIDSADFDIQNWNMRLLADAIPLSSITPNSWVEFDLNDYGLSVVNLTGNTVIGVVLSGDANNVAPTWASNVNSQIVFDSANGTNEPELIVVQKPKVNLNGYRMFCKTGCYVTNGGIARNGNTGSNGSNGTNGSGRTAGSGGSGGSGGSALASGSVYGGEAGVAGGGGGAGGAGGDGTSGVGGTNGSAGTSGAALTRGIGIAGGNGVAGATGGTGGNSAGGGASGGTGGTAGTGGTLTGPTASNRNLINAISQLDTGAATPALYRSSSQNGGNGGGGGGGGGKGTGGGAGSDGGGGGGGGGAGGNGSTGGKVLIASPIIEVGSGGYIKVEGGLGGNGGNGGRGGDGTSSGATTDGGGGGGGAGGSAGNGGPGGDITLIYNTYTNNGTVSVAGGLAGRFGDGGSGGSFGGTGAEGNTAGSDGANGSAGSQGLTGKIYLLQRT